MREVSSIPHKGTLTVGPESTPIAARILLPAAFHTAGDWQGEAITPDSPLYVVLASK
jgi:hypothetical protein